MEVWTIGHSSRTMERFLELLAGPRVELVADIRRFPGSRAHPHFAAASLAAVLPEQGIVYEPFPELGGRRSSKGPSPNTVWKNAAFRAYADYMETPAFAEGLARLQELARAQRTAILCSEAVWWRCHRSMVSDALKASGAEVLHIMEGGRADPHPYTAPARIVDGRLTYREAFD